MVEKYIPIEGLNQSSTPLGSASNEIKGKTLELLDITSIEINLIDGDITKVKSDVIITAINSGGMWFGGIDLVIQRTAGLQFHEQARKMLPLKNLDTVNARKQAYHSGLFENVLFVIDDLESPLNNVIFNGLKAADEAGYNSVSIPTMRMGVMVGVIEKTAQEIVKQMKIGVDEFKKLGPKNLKSITFVVYNDANAIKLIKSDFSV